MNSEFIYGRVTNLGGKILSLIKKKNKDIRIIPLGGVGEIAKNMYIVEVDDEMFMLDAGLMFPEDEMLVLILLYQTFHTYLKIKIN